MREQRYCMVQTVSQYEFIYEYMLDYLSARGIIKLKWPRDAFGLASEGSDDIDQDEESKMQGIQQTKEVLQGTSRGKLELKKFSLP